MSEENIYLYIISSVLFMLLFAISIVWIFNRAKIKIAKSKLEQKELELKFQQALLEDTVKVQENERNRISKDLHDGIASQLSIINLNIHLLKQKITVKGEIEQLIDHIETSLKSSTERTRKMSHELMPPMLKKFGLHYALHDLVTQINISKVFILIIENDHLINIKNEYKLLHIYRIIQELINNAIKYAQCKKVIVSFSGNGQNIEMVYNDDGIGFDVNQDKSGMGISNINTRIHLLKGTIYYESNAKNGTKFVFKFPNYD